MMSKIDLNSDLGESFGPWKMGMDAEVMESVCSANVACGFHAGDAEVMIKTVKAAKAAGVAVGAHPGHPDLQGFGRRTMAVTPDEAYAYTLYQIGALRAVCAAQGVPLEHVKAHGALYNQAAKDLALAKAIARATKDAGGDLILLGLANSLFEQAASEEGVLYAAEAFADRGYMDDGSLVPRSKPGAFVHDLKEAGERMVRLVKEGVIRSAEGKDIHLTAHSICLHGDNPAAVEMARHIRKTLEANGVEVRKIREVLKG
ncbi:hypothetical protein SDC9_125438 [bioreactor metagenome]|jgi:UPF0271 protein|uniref:5-oxoprolinase subunit A n=2 Tax=root TaxID=1 RepID=A0A645CND3_9ZZZZ